MTDSPSARRGRPRNPRTHEAILAATRELLLERGYPALTIDAVASHAGTAKTTIYRRWSTKGALVLAATADHTAIGVVPDSGDTREDLEIATRQLIRTFSDRLAAIVILAVIGNLDEDPSMARHLRDVTIYPWRTSAAAAIRRGVDRGDLPASTDVAFLLDVMVGTVFQRTITIPGAATDGLETAIVRLLMGD